MDHPASGELDFVGIEDRRLRMPRVGGDAPIDFIALQTLAREALQPELVLTHNRPRDGSFAVFALRRIQDPADQVRVDRNSRSAGADKASAQRIPMIVETNYRVYDTDIGNDGGILETARNILISSCGLLC